jgi:hypothetical protein
VHTPKDRDVWHWQGKTGGAFGFALIFWFFCIKTKEQKKKSQSKNNLTCFFLLTQKNNKKSQERNDVQPISFLRLVGL